ncbi:LysM peptidoglycan-binding domain-containing protein [Desulfobacula sp.]|uniref:LysM peptidoglycan-binding domain-containing protein n=1 Tax=Desulfobacula sp. TaxID=2593537 RepID=UPI002605DD68|nr:LysM peptidoglycan-binding domain-containing protein [Desulfobacula sp.]
MTPKEKPGSPLKTPKISKEKPSKARGSQKRMDTVLLKKNEFALILVGALVLTLVIFFLFFKSPGPTSESLQKNSSNVLVADLEKRMDRLENALETREPSLGSADDAAAKERGDMDTLKGRMTRLETAFSVKFDSITERMGSIEQQISRINRNPIAAVPPKQTPPPVIPVKKSLKKEPASALLHTVQKGETLYQISKQYNTSVETLRKLNQLSATAKIYPGNTIRIRN